MLSRAIFTLLVGKVRHEWYQVLSEDMPQHVARQPGLHRRGSTTGSRRIHSSATGDMLSGGGGGRVSASSSLRPSFEQYSYEPPLQFGSVGTGGDAAGGRVMLAAAAAALEYAGFCARTPSVGQELLGPSSVDGADRGMVVTGTNNSLLAARQSTSPLTSTEQERMGGSSSREHGASMVAAAAAAGLTVVPVMPRLKAVAAGKAVTPEARSSCSGLVDAGSIDEAQPMAQPLGSRSEQVDLESGAEGLLCDLASDIVVPCGPAPAVEGSGSGGPGSGAPAVSSSLVLVSGMGTGGGSPVSAQRAAASSGALPDAVSSSSPGSLSFRLPQGVPGPPGNNGGAGGAGLMGAWPMGRSGGQEEEPQQASRSGVTSTPAFTAPGSLSNSLTLAVVAGTAGTCGADCSAGTGASGAELPDADAGVEAGVGAGAAQPPGNLRVQALPPLVLSPHGNSASPSPGSTSVVRRVLSSKVSLAGASGSGGSRDQAAGSGGASGGAGGDVGPLLVTDSTRRDGGDPLDSGLTSVAEAHAESLAAMMDQAADLGMAMAESPSGLGLGLDMGLGLGLTSSSGREGRPGGAARPAAGSPTTTLGTTGTGTALQTMSSGGDTAMPAMAAAVAAAGTRSTAQSAGGTGDSYDSGQDGAGRRAAVASAVAPRLVGSGARTSSSPRRIGPASSTGRSSEPAAAAAELASCDCMTEAEAEGAEATEAEEEVDSQGSSRELQVGHRVMRVLVYCSTQPKTGPGTSGCSG